MPNRHLNLPCIISIFLLLLAPLLAHAEEGKNYGAMPNFHQGVGARSTGMGGAFVALADDATAGYWNPAGLTQMELYTYELGSQYAFLPNDMSFSYLSYSFQIPSNGALAISWLNFSNFNIERRDENENILGNINAAENAFLISYGRKAYGWLKGLSLGGNIKLLQQGIADHTAFGYGFDLAALWQPILYYDHTIGINIQNLFQRIYWDTSSKSADYTPVNVKVGTALKFLRSRDELYFTHLNTAVDLEFSEYQRFSLRLGVEYWFERSIGLRAGYNNQEVTVGASGHIKI